MKPPGLDRPKARPYERPAPPRRRGRWLQAERARLFASDPFCASCRRLLDPVRWIRDHVVPLAEGGRDEVSNTQALCLDCSDRKSEAEWKRGQARMKA